MRGLCFIRRSRLAANSANGVDGEEEGASEREDERNGERGVYPLKDSACSNGLHCFCGLIVHDCQIARALVLYQINRLRFGKKGPGLFSPSVAPSIFWRRRVELVARALLERRLGFG